MLSNTTHLKIITPSGIFYENDVSLVTVKTTEGYIGLQHGKPPFVASLEISELAIGSQSDKRSYKLCAIAGGIVYVQRDQVDIITDAIEFKEKIDIIRAQRDKKAAEAKLKQQKNSAAETLKAQIALKKAINRIEIKGS